MKKMKSGPNGPNQQADSDLATNLSGYPRYPDSDDIYSQSIEEADVDPEDIGRKKTYNESDESDYNEKDYDEDVSGDDLDVPGSELDDDQEDIGNEDEENNYYSLGGDNHNDLEEDQGE